jgi:hypothetical protein
LILDRTDKLITARIVPAIHVLIGGDSKKVNARDKHGHDLNALIV